MLTILKRYAVKHLNKGVARVYITNKAGLESAGLSQDVTYSTQYDHHRITATPCKNGNNTIMTTSRGLLLELKNTSTENSLKDVDFVTVTFSKDGVVITLSHSDKQKLEREQSLKQALCGERPLRKASILSGTGALSYQLKTGLESAGVNVQMSFAIDACDKAMSVNIEANPIWDGATDDALVVVDQLENLDINMLRPADIIEIGYTCIGMSTLCVSQNRDTNHPVVGLLYIKLLAALYKMNPSVVIFENAPFFINSDTLKIIKSEMKGYRFEEAVFNAYDFGEIEPRKRSCVIAISDGLPELQLNNLTPPAITRRPKLGDYLEDIPLDSPTWRRMDHIKKKERQDSLNFKNAVFVPTDTKIGTLIASYGAPKVGSPFIQHPTNVDLQRQLTPVEFGRIRQLPQAVNDLVMKIADGRHPLVSKRGSHSAAYRLMGNGVSKWVWLAIGNFLGNYLLRDVKPRCEKIVVAA
ncbi:hypothetical protein FMO003_25020 [Moritella sp. F3]|nr:hypothetical protein FMO001_18290 [Moritella sp. F1]GIC82221.1 hypothetical protein FMO003_25020 [Moritella sp. F3]